MSDSQLAVTTSKKSLLQKLQAWAHKKSVWPFSVSLSCCALEYQAARDPLIGQVDSSLLADSFTPEESDVLIVAGTVTERLMPEIKEIYDRMPGPKWVVAVGSCASSGGIYNSYSVVRGIEEFLPVDLFIPGCPPSPEDIHHGLKTFLDTFSLEKKETQNAHS